MATITLPSIITPAILHAVEATMRHCFAELEQAEHERAPAAVMERLYAAFLQATAVYQTASTRLHAVDPPLGASFAQPTLFDAS